MKFIIITILLTSLISCAAEQNASSVQNGVWSSYQREGERHRRVTELYDKARQMILKLDADLTESKRNRQILATKSTEQQKAISELKNLNIDSSCKNSL